MTRQRMATTRWVPWLLVAAASVGGAAARGGDVPGWPFDGAEAKRRQQEAARAAGVPVERTVQLGPGVSIGFVLVPAGRFAMGSPAGEAGRESGKCAPENQHEVILSRPFYLARTETTQAQYEAVLGENPSKAPGPDLPAEKVAWDRAGAFCVRVGELAKSQGRLPTEAEWEWACRAGSGGAHCLGNDPALLDRIAWHTRNSGNRTHPVGRKEPNAWGLHDMHGNVMEWVHDAWLRPEPYPEGPLTDPTGNLKGGHRIRRGAFYGQGPEQMRSAHRHYGVGSHTDGNMGFRALLEIPRAGSEGK
jgi:formylglycine-generating enzyme required for sulfatase activity